MAKGSTIAFLLIGIAVIFLGILVLNGWAAENLKVEAFNLAIAVCQGDPSCIAVNEASLGNSALLVQIYLYSGFGCIAVGAVFLILAVSRLLKGN